ncbi:unnamed protein product [Prorocentrum cordatum]|uniref:Uncharacterized protein n=1 Tax=Prorocentrum cordatum TaxID=2364126 RepID=A0ABN9TQK7_9DINO|nr:unnamed protein product [Polarella glacialis]
MEGQICRNNPYTLDIAWEGLTENCNGWYKLTASRCMRKCLDNANAPSCPSSPTGKCIAFYPALRWKASALLWSRMRTTTTTTRGDPGYGPMRGMQLCMVSRGSARNDTHHHHP